MFERHLGMEKGFLGMPDTFHLQELSGTMHQFKSLSVIFFLANSPFNSKNLETAMEAAVQAIES